MCFVRIFIGILLFPLFISFLRRTFAAVMFRALQFALKRNIV